MSKKSVVTVDIGSSSIVATAGERGVNKTYQETKPYREEYEGFSSSGFFDESEAGNAIFKCLDDLLENEDLTCDKVYFGVPSAFIGLENKKLRIKYDKQKKIRANDIDELFDAGRKSVKTEHYIPISQNAIYFVLDDGSITYDPVGAKSASLGGHLSFVTCDANFVRVVKDAAKKCGIGEIVFVCDLLAESLIALGDNSRGKVLLVDSGYITTGAAVISPRGVLKKTSCDYGGGYITALLYEKFGLSLETAEDLKRKINLGMMRSPESLYRIYDGNKTVVLPASEVNDAVRESLDELVGELDAFIAESEMGDNLKILLTGGGLAYLRGVREHISDRLDIPVEIFAPPSVQFSKCFDTSKVALLECALRDKEKTGRIKFLTIEE